MKKKILLATLILAGFSIIFINFARLDLSTNLAINTVFAADEDVADFKDNDSEAKKWAEEQEQLWNINRDEKQLLQSYVDNDRDILSSQESFDLTPLEMTEDNPLKEDYTKLRGILSKAKLGSGVMCYKDYDASDFGLIGDVDSDNFQKQFLGKDVKLTNYLDAKLTNSSLDKGSNLILNLKIPGSKGTNFRPESGVFLDSKTKEPKLLVNNTYNIHIENSRDEVIKGKKVIFVSATLKNNLDFKNDSKIAEQWGNSNYSDWAPKEKTADNQLDSTQIEALNGYFNNDYKEINSYLRTGESGENQELEEKINNISEGLAVRPVPNDLTVYRWMGFKDLGYDALPNLETLQNDFIGKANDDKAFMSTSIYSGSATFSSPRSILLRLNVSKGTHGGFPVGANINPDSMLTVKGGECELLLDKGQEYEVYKITQTTVRGKTKFIIDANLK